MHGWWLTAMFMLCMCVRYDLPEKVAIAKQYLIPKARAEAGIAQDREDVPKSVGIAEGERAAPPAGSQPDLTRGGGGGVVQRRSTPWCGGTAVRRA